MKRKLCSFSFRLVCKKKSTVQNAQFGRDKIVKFVHTYSGEGGIIIPVKPPNTLYIVFAIPHSKNTFS